MYSVIAHPEELSQQIDNELGAAAELIHDHEYAEAKRRIEIAREAFCKLAGLRKDDDTSFPFGPDPSACPYWRKGSKPIEVVSLVGSTKAGKFRRLHVCGCGAVYDDWGSHIAVPGQPH